MQPVKLSAAQKAQIEAQVGAIDFGKLDWSKIGMLLQIILQMLMSQQPKQAKALEHCSHEECCLATLQATAEAFQAALHCYQSCEPTEATS